MKTLRRFLVLLLLLAFIPAAQAQTATPQPPKEKVTIAQFGKERFLLYLPLYVAMEEGVFGKNGIDVDLKFAGNDDQIFATVISGAAQFGVGDPVFTAISHDKGGPGKVVAMMITNLGVGGIANDPKIPVIKTPDNLDGLRIGSLPEPSTTFTLLTGVKKRYGLNLQIVQAPIDGQVALLEAGKADIAVDLEPDLSIFVDKGYRLVFDLAIWTDP
jgi:NitT/TauT family transport system substrate-binding protein